MNSCEKVEYKQKTLIDLPVLPIWRDGNDDIVIESYLKELRSISTKEELQNFTNKWRNVWLLSGKVGEVSPSIEEVSILNGTYDLQEVLHFLSILKDPTYPYNTSFSARVAANIALPCSIVDAYVLAKEFGVGSDLALVRLYLDPYDPNREKVVDRFDNNY